MATKFKSAISASAIGVLAYMIAAVFHELIGHGGAALAKGQDIKLISSVYFRSVPGSVISDLGGPMTNLVLGLLIYLLLNLRKNLSNFLRLLLLIVMAYNFFWFSGTIFKSAFSEQGDWIYAIEELNLEAVKTPALVLLGIAAYFFSVRLVRIQVDKEYLNAGPFSLTCIFYYSWFAAFAAAGVAGLFFMPDRIQAASEGLLEMMASVPILLMRNRTGVSAEYLELSANYTFSLIVFILLLAFCLTLGVGIT